MAVFFCSHSYCRWELARINVLRNKSLFCFDIRRLFSCDTALAQCLSAAFGHWHCWVSLQSCCNAVVIDLKPENPMSLLWPPFCTDFARDVTVFLP